MINVVSSPVLYHTFLDENGRPLVGGTLETYLAGSTIPVQTYTDVSGTVQHPQSISIPSDGTVRLFLDPALVYRFVIKRSSGATFKVVDNVVPPEASGGSASGLVRVSNEDTEAGYLADKLKAGSNIALTVEDDEGVKTIRISCADQALSDLQQAYAVGDGAIVIDDDTDKPFALSYDAAYWSDVTRIHAAYASLGDLRLTYDALEYGRSASPFVARSDDDGFRWAGFREHASYGDTYIRADEVAGLRVDRPSGENIEISIHDDSTFYLRQRFDVNVGLDMSHTRTSFSEQRRTADDRERYESFNQNSYTMHLKQNGGRFDRQISDVQYQEIRQKLSGYRDTTQLSETQFIQNIQKVSGAQAFFQNVISDDLFRTQWSRTGRGTAEVSLGVNANPSLSMSVRNTSELGKSDIFVNNFFSAVNTSWLGTVSTSASMISLDGEAAVRVSSDGEFVVNLKSYERSFIKHGLETEGQIFSKRVVKTWTPTITINWNHGNFQEVTLAGNTGFNLTQNPQLGATYGILINNPGGHSVTWPLAVKWSEGDVPDLTTAGIHMITFYYTNLGGEGMYLALAAKNFV